MRKVKLTYFKESGKYYSEGEYITEIEEYHDWLIYKEVVEMHPLPGLIGGWDGQVLVVPDNGVPALVRVVRHSGCSSCAYGLYPGVPCTICGRSE